MGVGRKDVEGVDCVVAAAGDAGVGGAVDAAYDKQIVAGRENAFFAVELRLEEVVVLCPACDDGFAASGLEQGYEDGLGCRGVVFGMEPDGDGIAVAGLVVGRLVIAAFADDEVFAACLDGEEGDAVPRVVGVGDVVGRIVVYDEVAGLCRAFCRLDGCCSACLGVVALDG